MNAFSYFLAFYSIVLGLSLVELLAGLARTIDNRRSSRPSRLTLLLALFVTLDLSSYWIQAWWLYQNAPLSMTIITHGLIAAGSYYVAAYLIFPRRYGELPAEHPGEHFWDTRRWIFGAVLLTNVLNIGTMALLTGGLGFIGSPPYVAFIATFYVACAIAAAAPRGRVVTASLVWLIVFSLISLGLDLANVVDAGPWALGGSASTASGS